MLHSHNCLGNDATQPEFPIVKPMKTFRGEKLTHDVAEQIMQGWLGSERDGKKVSTPGSRSLVKIQRTIIFRHNTKYGTPERRAIRFGTIQCLKSTR